MQSLKPAVFALLACLLLVGCATHHYRPAPISAPETASNFERRTLADPMLKQYLEKNLGHGIADWPIKTWDLGTLTLAAFYFNPSIEAARNHVATVEGSVVTAGARPNPTLSVSPGVPSPYLFGVDLSFQVETAGKRGYRVQHAQNLSEAARFELAEAAWKVRNGVRSALLAYLLPERSLGLLRSEEQIREEQVKLLERRVAVGEIPRPDADLARIELSKTRLSVRVAEGRLRQGRAELAAAIGVPDAALEGIEFYWPDLDSPPSAESLTPQRIQRDAVLNRLDVRRRLVEYAASEADLRLEIAKQYPDFTIGPGYQFEERNNFLTVVSAVTLPIFNRNQGPIAEAEGRRKEAASRFLITQAQVIAESERALAPYRAALEELAEANDSLRKLQTVRERMTQQAVRVGEADRLVLNGVLLESSVVATARLGALGRAQVALGDLEDAVQRPLTGGDIVPLSPSSPALDAPGKESKR